MAGTAGCTWGGKEASAQAPSLLGARASLKIQHPKKHSPQNLLGPWKAGFITLRNPIPGLLEDQEEGLKP